jgi:hypothetical protein
MTPLEKHLEERHGMASALVGEIHGPHSDYSKLDGTIKIPSVPINPVAGLVFNSWEEYGRRHVDAATGEEILKEDGPSKLYGVGILFPMAEPEVANPGAGEASVEPTEQDAAAEATLGLSDGSASDENASERKLSAKLSSLGERIGRIKDDGDSTDDADENELDGLKLARIRKPQSMGITFACDLKPTVRLRVVVAGGRYRPVEGIKVKKSAETDKTSERQWWVRVPVTATLELAAGELTSGIKREAMLAPQAIVGLQPLKLSLEVQCRPAPATHGESQAPTRRLVTLTLINRTAGTRGQQDKQCLFQARFKAFAEDAEGHSTIVPLPSIHEVADSEERSLALLYRNSRVFAAGHGCAGVWEADEGKSTARSVIAEPIPRSETPPVTPDLTDPASGLTLSIPMAPLAAGEAGWIAPLERLHVLYTAWIDKTEKEIHGIAPAFHEAAHRHISGCRQCADRIAAGLTLLKSDAGAAEAFRLTNRAMLLQQIAGRAPTRPLNYAPRSRQVTWEKDPVLPTLQHAESGKRAWRPFQIAFLLMSLPGLWDEKNTDRDIADLIWFPTGGGKTEAYLAASAFALFSRRLNDTEDAGTTVLMRYTLRLLTSQQFQRAAGLTCAMEAIRRESPDKLGEKPFTIGIWVGGTTTPNNRKLSVESYHKASQDGPEAYAHVLLRCPWCASAMGPRKKLPFEPGSQRYACEGLRLTGKGESASVLLHCPDRRCTFNEALPVSVVDEEIYETPPGIVIGTVDKFAMLAWKEEARALFGLGMDGKRHASPPSLIIQDELHLITGPLGSMVGLYEGLVEELSTDRRGPVPVRPKLVASTATTRASTRQIRELYAREKTAVFPPPGLDAGDSFFARYDRHPAGHPEAGRVKPGRMYLGVLARAYGSGLTVNVRTFAALLAAAGRTGTDPWWSLLVFYNSLRELGSGLTLFGADIPERLKDLRDRWSPGQKRRYLSEEGVLELTGRLNNSDVPRALERLERKRDEKGVIDACLASNIIEVGVDVPRLGLMAVAGQPKNTAQYIQATGRIGRELPGLVVMVYDNRKPRDLSHFEQFRSYHERLYASVEPASVTPFTLPVLERALHGVFIAWVRQLLPKSDILIPRGIDQPNNPIRKAVLAFAASTRQRIRVLYSHDPATLKYTEDLLYRVLKQRLKEWSEANPSAWENRDITGTSGDRPLMRYFGKPCPIEWEDFVWPTPTSMRGVDAECLATVYNGPIGSDSTAKPPADSSDLDAIFGD